jgi:imidazole glycerol phosphate synthase glutamine amidotransferase subunit
VSGLVIVDSGIANLASIRGAFGVLGIDCTVTRDAATVRAATRLVVPGVGAFGAGRAALAHGALDRAILERAASGIPVLGICLGFQLLTEGSDEAPGVAGLGLVSGTCRRLPRSVRVPQLGWNGVEPGVGARFVMVGGYAAYANSFALPAPHGPAAGESVAISHHGIDFVAAFERDGLLGCQFHPELSGPWGLALLSRWLDPASARRSPAATLITPSSGLTHRIIPCLDVANGRVVKGVNFQRLRDVGEPAELAARYQDEGADELVFLDIAASVESRAAALESVRRARAVLQIPLTVGGGVRTVDDAARLLEAGADKVSVNSAAVRRPELLSELAQAFGRQAVVLAIDARRRNRFWEVLTLGGREVGQPDALAWGRAGSRLGAGEILLTSWDRDGTDLGPDVELLRAMRRRVEVPIIASGGLGDRAAFAAAFGAGADAALAASLFHDRRDSIAGVKRELLERGIALREVA